MSNVAQKAILTAKINGVLKDLMVKTSADQVFIDDSTTLAAKLTELVSALDGKAAVNHTHEADSLFATSADGNRRSLQKVLDEKATTEAMNGAISAAISELIGGAPETYNTLKEIADYIEAHKEVVDALNAAISNKADASVVTTLQETVTAIKTVTDSLGALATKDSVAESDLDEALKAKINASTAANHSHDNKTVLDGITADLVTAWNGKSTIYYSATQPIGLAEGDLWVQLID